MSTVRKLHEMDPAGTVDLDEDRVRLTDFVVEDVGLVELLAGRPPEHWPDLVRQALGVGARGLLTMGVGIDVASVDARVRQTLAAVTGEAERRVTELLEQGRRAFTEQLDPERRSSLLARTLADFVQWRDGVMARIDPDRSDSHTATFLDRLGSLLGPHGALEQRLAAALDPQADGSAMHHIDVTMEQRFRELRELIMREEGRRAGRIEESSRGTAQGFDYENLVEERLRGLAAGYGGCTVERTGRLAGLLGPKATVGDFVVTLSSGDRIVVEAKQQASVTLTGRDGILAELDRAMANREAGFAVCVSARDAFPAEVGLFGVYGDRVLVVDDGDGAMIAVALRWAEAALATRRAGKDGDIDLALVSERIDRIRKLAERFKTSRRSLSDVVKSIDTVREALSDMRAELLDLVDEVQHAVS